VGQTVVDQVRRRELTACSYGNHDLIAGFGRSGVRLISPVDAGASRAYLQARPSRPRIRPSNEG